MRANPMKSIWIAVIIAAVLLLVAAPGIAAASMEKAADNCDPNPCQEGAVIPPCCLAANCLLSHCILSSAVASEVLPPSRLTQNEDVYPAWSPASLTPETSLNPQKPFQRDPTQELPSHLCTEYHCRNCLNSEEPHQV